jgi:hypothetical protein
MTRPVTLLHTSPVHVATFDGLRDRLDPEAVLAHEVREDWLAQARVDGVTDTLASEITALVRSAESPVLCTCSTLGEAAAEAGAIRIDAPMMQRATEIGGKVLLVYVLESTRHASETLLRDALEASGQPGNYQALGLPALWDMFEAGDHAGFTKAIADAVTEVVQDQSDFRVVVLAQASMAGAVDALKALPVITLSSPEPALQAALAAR